MAFFNKESQSDPYPTAKNFNKIALIIIILSAIFVALFLLYRQGLWPIGNNGPKNEGQKIYIPKVLYNLAGVVEKIEKKSFSMQASIPRADKNGNIIQDKETRTVKIDSSTKFTAVTFAFKEGQVGKVPVENPINFEDIKAGDFVEVVSTEDISKDAEFEANLVRVLPKI